MREALFKNKRPPFITGDGELADVSEVHLHEQLAVPQVFGTVRFSQTSDAMRGLVRDLACRAAAEGRLFSDYCTLSGRSGHSRVGVDIELLPEPPQISDRNRTVEMCVSVTALNSMMADALSGLQEMSRHEKIGIGRLFIPLSEALDRDEIIDALDRNHLMLPETNEISNDGVIHIPLDNVRYVCSARLIRLSSNFKEILLLGKHGLNLVQGVSPAGRPAFIQPQEFMVSAVRISLGPYAAFIQRSLNTPGVYHLASRLLDGVRTTGMSIHRHVELYNSGPEPAATDKLRVSVKLYPADERAGAIASRILTPERAGRIMRQGVDVADLTDIFNIERCNVLFDEISALPTEGGSYGRICIPRKLVNIPWEQENGSWLQEFQWRLVYEAARGNMVEGVLRGEEIPQRFRTFLEELKYVGGEQKLSKVFVVDALPPVDTLRVLKRNGIGVVLARSMRRRPEEPANGPEYFVDQTTYEELVRLEGEGMRFYMPFGKGESAHVREFHQGLWVTARGKERLQDIHTTIAVFGSAVGETRERFKVLFRDFLAALQSDERLGENFAVAHGSGPGIMKAVDEAAADLNVFRMGVGIEAEKIGQTSNFAPEALVQFVALAMNTRQDILDRRSIFKIFNVGGFGTSYEINMALTFMKINHCLPAPYVFVDPYGLGKDGGHLWESSMQQFEVITTRRHTSQLEMGPLGPAWVKSCCHLVQSYEEGQQVIAMFLDDPAAYWRRAGVSASVVRTARNNLVAAGIVMPPYVEEGLQHYEQEAGQETRAN